MEKYIWADLIQFFERENYIYNGLTIPFLIGVVALLKNRKMTISEFTEELMDSKNQKRPTIMICGNIGEFVIGIMDNETKNYYRTYPKNVIKSFDNLAVTDSSLDDYYKKSELIALFEKKYNDKIYNGYYSKNKEQWMGFTPIDQERIENYKNAAANKG